MSTNPEKQQKRNEDALKLTDFVSRILFIKNKRDLTDKEKNKGISEWLETPEGIQKMRKRFVLLCMLVNAPTDILYKERYWKLYALGFISLIGGIVLRILFGPNLFLIAGICIIVFSMLEGLVLGTIIVDDMYDKSILKYAAPESLPDMVARDKANTRKFYAMLEENDIDGFSDEGKILRYGGGVRRYSGLSSDEAKKVYRNLVKMYHPDNCDNPCAPAMLDKLKKEYEEYAAYVKWCEEHGYDIVPVFCEPQRYEDVELML